MAFAVAESAGSDIFVTREGKLRKNIMGLIIGSLKHITHPNYELLLVDNGSTDGSVECFREQMIGINRNQIETLLYNNAA